MVPLCRCKGCSICVRFFGPVRRAFRSCAAGDVASLTGRNDRPFGAGGGRMRALFPGAGRPFDPMIPARTIAAGLGGRSAGRIGAAPAVRRCGGWGFPGVRLLAGRFPAERRETCDVFHGFGCIGQAVSCGALPAKRTDLGRRRIGSVRLRGAVLRRAAEIGPGAETEESFGRTRAAEARQQAVEPLVRAVCVRSRSGRGPGDGCAGAARRGSFTARDRSPSRPTDGSA